MKQRAYHAPHSSVIKFELCDHLMFLPQSQQGGDQMSEKMEFDDNASWDSNEWTDNEE